MCALLHDVGKVGVPTDLLHKPGALTSDEFATVKEHAAIGARLVGRVPELQETMPLVRAVHERWDGAGYPDGLHAGDIPIEARIVALCDAWAAMTEERPYRPALSHAEALDELRRNAASQFDPELVEVLLAVLDENPSLAASGPDAG